MTNSTSTANCCSIFSKAIAPEQAQDIAAIFKVLGEPARLQLLSFIASQLPQDYSLISKCLERRKSIAKLAVLHLSVPA